MWKVRVVLWCCWEEGGGVDFGGGFPCLGKFNVVFVGGGFDGIGVYGCVRYSF